MALSDKSESMAQNSNMKTREKTVFVAQQLHFANTLAGNDPVHRARAMKKLRKYFFARANGNFNFTHDDFMRIWKGLFYCMWMSDKPLIQEELAEEISQLIHCFQLVGMAFTFAQAFFDTLLVEWFGIDYHRLDKFQMFVRRFLRQCLVYCKNKHWKRVVVTGLCDVLESTVLSPSKCVNECGDMSLIMHFSEIFVEELAKVVNGKLPDGILLQFLKPFMANLSGQSDFRLQDVIRDRVFYCLIKQSPEGLEYEEKFEAWKRAGFPGTSWKEMVFVGKEDHRSGVKIKNLDPRAGKVNVYLPHLQFDAASVAATLREYAEKSSSKQCQKFILKLEHKFQELSEGRYPLAINLSKSLLDSRKYQFSKQKIDDAVEDLLDFDEQLKEKDKIMKKSGKRKKNASKLIKSKKIKLEKTSANEEYDSGGSCENLEEEEEEDASEKQEDIDHYSTENGEMEGLHTTVLQNNVTIHENNLNSDLDEKGFVTCELNKECAFDNETGNTSLSKVTKKTNKRHSVSSWSVSEISSFQEESGQTQETFKENGLEEEMQSKEENPSSKDTLLENKLPNSGLFEATLERHESEILSNAEVKKNVLDVKHCASVLNGETNVPQEGIQEESTVACEELETVDQAKEVLTRHKSPRRTTNDPQEGDQEETILTCEELENVDQVRDVITPLRRSARRITNIFRLDENAKAMENGITVPATSTPVRSSARIRLSKLENQGGKSMANYLSEGKEMIADASSNQSSTESAQRTSLLRTPAKRRMSKLENQGGKSLGNSSVEEKEKITDESSNQSVSESAKRTSLVRTPVKRRLSKIDTPNEANEEEEKKSNESRLSKENEQSPSPKRRSFSPYGVIRGKGRISTVPDREIPNIHESDKLSTPVNNITTNLLDSSASSPEIETCNGVLRNNEMGNKEERSSLSSQKKFDTHGKKSPGKKRVSLHATPGSGKKVNIVLQMNKSQAFPEYVAAVLQSPSVPHDANKMPCKGVLKRTSIKSPINPFYVPPKGLK